MLGFLSLWPFVIINCEIMECVGNGVVQCLIRSDGGNRSIRNKFMWISIKITADQIHTNLMQIKQLRLDRPLINTFGSIYGPNTLRPIVFQAINRTS